MLLPLFLAACGGGGDGAGFLPPNPEPVPQALVRVVHASPGAPAVDVYAEGSATPLLSNIAYGAASAYVQVPEGVYNLEVRATGALPTSPPVYETGGLFLPGDERITAVAAGLLSPGSADQAFRVLPFVEGFVAPGAGNAALRIVHAGADAPAVALDVGDDGLAELSGLIRYGETGAAGVGLPSGEALQVAILVDSTLNRVTAFTTPELPEGAELFVIATGLLQSLPREESGFGLLVVGPDGVVGFLRQNPMLYLLHASPDAPPVDVYLDTTELIDDLAYSRLSAGLQVPPGAYTLEVKQHDDGPTVDFVTTPELAAGRSYLAIATGFATGPTPAFQVLALDEGFTLDDEQAFARVVHASPDAPAVDVGVVDVQGFVPVADFAGLSFGAASPSVGTALPTQPFIAGVATPPGSGNVAVRFELSPQPGQRLYAVAAGSLTGLGEPFELLVVDTTNLPWQVVRVPPVPPSPDE